MENKIIRCQDCYNKFIFTIRQQQTYAEHGWQDPIRCPSCRARKKEIYTINENHKNNLITKQSFCHKFGLFHKQDK